MFSSFYNSVAFHTLFAKEVSTDYEERKLKSRSILDTPYSVTFQTSIVSSPKAKAVRSRPPKGILSSKLKAKRVSIASLVDSLPIIIPFGRFHLVWSIMLFATLTYSVIETPYTVVFVGEISLYDATYLVSVLIDALLFIDIAINFRTAYIDKYDRLRIIHEPKLIAKHYCVTWFTIDFIAAFPFSLIDALSLGIHTGHFILLFRMLRLIKLVRIMRILNMFKYFHQQTLQYESRSILKLFKIFVFMLLTAHYCACFWFFIGRYTYDKGMDSWLDGVIEEEGASLNKIPQFKLYSFSMYWSILTLFTTGYGDIVAHNTFEQWSAIFCTLIGSVFFAYFIGMLSTLMNETHDRVRGREHRKIEESLLFCSHYNFPKELTQAIVTHIRYYQKYNFVFSKTDIMDALPSYLQKSVEKHLAKNILQGLDIFQSLSSSIVGQIALKLKSKSINAGHSLFKTGDIGKEMYIQRTGKSKLFYGGETSYYRKLQRGDVCGENVIMNRKRMHSVKCITWSEFYVLDIRDIIDILKNNLEPLTAQNEWEKIKQIVRGTMHTTAPRHIAVPSPRFEEFVPSELCNNDENALEVEKPNKQQKVSFQSLQELFNMTTEKSVHRNNHVLRHHDKRTSDLFLELPDHSPCDEFDDIECRLHTIDDKSNVSNSSDSGGFGERFGLYKIRKLKKKTSNDTLGSKRPNITGILLDDIMNDSAVSLPFLNGNK